MTCIDHFQNDHDAVHNKGSLTHDALAGAVAWQVAKAWENHVAANGRPVGHRKAKEFLAAAAAAAVTHLAETKGADAWDAHKRAQLQQQAEARLNEAIVMKEYREVDVYQ